MRVTNNVLSSRVIYNMQRSLGRFLDMQTQLSSGRRINKPSDDPLGTLRDLDYRTELKKMSQYRSNIDQALNWQQSYDQVLAEAKDLITTAKELALACSGDNYNAEARRASADEIESIFNQLVSLANNEVGAKSIFSGYRTDARAVVASGNGAVYNGNGGAIEFQIETSAKVPINFTGDKVFLQPLNVLGAEADLNLGVTAATLLADLNGGDGVDLTTGATPGTITITDLNLGLAATIDLSAETVLGDGTGPGVIQTINNELAAAGINDIEVALGFVGNNLEFRTTASGLISGSTSLGVINQGAGWDNDPAEIRLTDGGATDITVYLSGATEIDDIIAAFNAAAPPNVTMDIDPVGQKGLRIVDSNGVPLGLRIEDFGENTTARDLGIVGDIGPTLTGSDLEPRLAYKVEETSGTTAADLGILGEYVGDQQGRDIDPALVAGANLTDLKNGSGMDWGQIVIWQGNETRTLDLTDPTLITVQDLLNKFNNCGLDITAELNPAGTGIQIVNDDPYSSFSIEDATAEDHIAKDLGIFGAGDMIAALAVLRNAMRNDDRDGIELAAENLDPAIEHLLNKRGVNGSRGVRLETTDARLSSLEVSFTELLAEVEDADLTQVVTDLATYENSYQAGLMATAKVIQPTLMDFLK